MIIRSIAAATALLSGLAAAEPVFNPATKVYVDKGAAAYASKDYAAAAAAFSSAFALEPRRELLFAWAQSERLKGDCGAALQLYRRFLTFSPPKEEVDRALKQIERCELLMGGGTTAPPAPPATVPVSPPTSVSPDATSRAVHWYADPWADSLAIAGVATSVAAAALFYAAQSSDRATSTAPTYADFLRQASLTDQRRAWGSVGAAVAVGLLTAATWRYVHGAKPPTVAAGVGPAGAAIAVRF